MIPLYRLLLFQPKDAEDKVPFDLSDFRYEEIVDSTQITDKAIYNKVLRKTE